MAAGYLIHKHQQNKKDKQRLEDEAASLEESQYRIFPEDGPSQHRRRRSHSRERRDSRGRHSHERHDRRRHDRPHSADSKYRREERSPRRDSGRPPKPQMNPLPPQMQMPAPMPTQMPPSAMRPPYPQPQPQPQAFAPPPYADIPNTNPAPPQDMKYGWTDESNTTRPQQDPNDPPTGWPSHWEQSQNPPASGYGARISASQQNGGGESSGSRGRHERRTPEPTQRVRFAVPARDRSLSKSPPPSYRA